jgi:uncharacterized protein DUF3631
MLDRVATFISQYLSCTEQQSTVLALWALHTYCYSAFSTAPYLNIRSPEHESGKTTCLQVLSTLCHEPWLVSGIKVPLLARKIANDRPTVLLDDWETSFRSVDRQAITGALLGGSHNQHSYAVAENTGRGPEVRTLNLLCPKAFSSAEPLPPALARRAVPILLKRAKPSDPIQPFRSATAEEKALPLSKWMKSWAEKNLDNLASAQLHSAPGRTLQGLSPHQQDACDAFLLIAQRIGGAWPQEAAEALRHILKAHTDQRESATIELLSDARDCFAHHGNPEWLATADMLEWLHSLDHRLWAAWKKNKPMTGYALADLLYPHDIRPRLKRTSSKTGARGYSRTEFAEAWERYLTEPPEPAIPPEPPPKPDQTEQEPTIQKSDKSLTSKSSNKSIPSTRKKPSRSAKSGSSNRPGSQISRSPDHPISRFFNVHAAGNTRTLWSTLFRRTAQ